MCVLPICKSILSADFSGTLSHAECVFLPFRATFTLRAQLRLPGTCVLYGPLLWPSEHIEVQVEDSLVRRKGLSVQIQLERVVYDLLRERPRERGHTIRSGRACAPATCGAGSSSDREWRACDGRLGQARAVLRALANGSGLWARGGDSRLGRAGSWAADFSHQRQDEEGGSLP